MAVRRFVVVGLGNFGFGLVEMLHARGHDVIAVDANEDKVERARRFASRAAALDATSPGALERIGAADADAGVVSVGTDIAGSVLAVMALLDLGVKEVYAKAVSSDHARILDRLGVAEVIRPERETAFRLARRLSMRLLNYLPIAAGYSMQEIPTPDAFIGETLVSLRLPQRYNVSVVAVHDVLSDTLHVPPSADYVLKDSDTLMVVGSDEALAELNAVDAT
jgi:trk system potassium uptake protein